MKLRRGLHKVAQAMICLACSLPANAQDTVRSTRIAGAVYLGDAPTVIAEARGLFEEQRIEAEITYSDSGKQSLERLRNGQADFALSALTPVVLDRLADETPGGADDPVIIASLVHSNDLLEIITPGESTIRVPADFQGKRIAINRGTNTEFAWWLYEQYHGLDRATVELVDMSFAQMPEALHAGRVDAALLWEHRVSNFDARAHEAGRGKANRIQLNDLYAGKWVLLSTRNTASNRQELCARVLRAYDEAIAFIERSPGQAVAIYRRQFNMPAGDDGLARNALAFDLGLDWSLIAGLQEQIHWAGVAGYENVSGQTVRVLDLLEAGPLLREWPSRVGIPVENPERPGP